MLDLEKFIMRWNAQYPFDKYIRQKYNIMFGSEAHKQLNFINMAIEYWEDKIIARETQKSVDAEDKKLWASILPTETFPGQNQPANAVKKMSKKEIDQEFETLNLKDFNDPVK